MVVVVWRVADLDPDREGLRKCDHPEKREREEETVIRRPDRLPEEMESERRRSRIGLLEKRY